MPASDIIIKGAREHNLRDVDLVLPRNQLICLTGVSGSGKSSLAFDTLYAEGQRRYVESLSTFARQFLGQMPKPDVDHISGLSPSISIAPKSAGSNPRSTVGTITEIYDFLRVLYARVGQGHCPECDQPITAQSREQIIARILSQPAKTKFASPGSDRACSRKASSATCSKILLKQGFVRARVDGEIGAADRRPATRPADATRHRSGRRPLRSNGIVDPQSSWPKRSSWHSNWAKPAPTSDRRTRRSRQIRTQPRRSLKRKNDRKAYEARATSSSRPTTRAIRAASASTTNAAAVQLQQPPGHVLRVRRAWYDLYTFDSGAADPRSFAVIAQAKGCDRTGRQPGKRLGTVEAPYLPGSCRHGRASNANSRAGTVLETPWQDLAPTNSRNCWLVRNGRPAHYVTRGEVARHSHQVRWHITMGIIPDLHGQVSGGEEQVADRASSKSS